MKILAKYLGGSKSYGLDTAESDNDIRYVFLNEDLGHILGLDKYEHQSVQNENEDSLGWELRHFFNLLRRGNSQAVEMLFNSRWTELSPEFEKIKLYKSKLIDSEKLFKCLCGYAHSERRLVNGEKTGVLGAKRRKALDLYGYSYKNLVQFIRLMAAGSQFYRTGVFPVNMKYDADKKEIFDLLWSIKTNPGKYNLQLAAEFMNTYEQIFKESYDSSKIKTTFDEDLANSFILSNYLPILKKFQND